MRQRHDRYILEGTEPVAVADLRTWCRWLETADRRVARTTVAPDVEVITIFLGLDDQWGAGPPLLFETRVVQVDPTARPGRRRFDDFRARYSTWQEAEHGHVAMCARVRQALAVTALPPCPPGSLCEVCLDAPVVGLQSAPWSGEWGVCAACAQSSEEA